MHLSLSEILGKAVAITDRAEKIKWLAQNNSTQLRNVLICMYDKTRIKFLIDADRILFKPSNAVDNHAAWYREVRKLKYLFQNEEIGKGLAVQKRYAVAGEMLETIHKDDTEYFLRMIAQRPLKGLSSQMITEALGPILSSTSDDDTE